MNDDLRTSFLTYYLQSLKERTRVEKGVIKNGLDWVVYSLGLANGFRPIRLPFFRNSGSELPNAKTEIEYGIDESFVVEEEKKLLIFVLKDERLTNSKWTNNDFDGDLRRAITPDLNDPSLKGITQVEVILVYNKDEDSGGTGLFDRFVQNAPTKLRDTISLSISRWNLSRLVREVSERLMNPNLLPEKYFSQFSYICAQFADFTHGSDQWENQLIPNWKAFLREVLAERSGERAVLMLPVTLLILREYGKNNPSCETGLIDLTEWAVLAAWAAALESKDEIGLSAAQLLYGTFYLVQLERFYRAHGDIISKEHVLDQGGGGGHGVAQAANAIKALWHTARVGLLAFGYFQVLAHKTKEEKEEHAKLAFEWAHLMISLLNASPATDRPILDIHHIELFLIWRALIQVDKKKDIATWLVHLEKNLFIRRIGQDHLIFVHGGLDYDPVWEYLASGERPPEFNDSGSTLVVMLMMFCHALPISERDALMLLIWKDLVLVHDSQGQVIRDRQPLNLMVWQPPKDWCPRILRENISQDGECIVLQLFEMGLEPTTGDQLANELERFVQQVRANRDTKLPDDIPTSLIALACLKHRNPLPMEIWCTSIYKAQVTSSEAPLVTAARHNARLYAMLDGAQNNHDEPPAAFPPE